MHRSTPLASCLARHPDGVTPSGCPGSRIAKRRQRVMPVWREMRTNVVQPDAYRLAIKITTQKWSQPWVPLPRV